MSVTTPHTSTSSLTSTAATTAGTEPTRVTTVQKRRPLLLSAEVWAPASVVLLLLGVWIALSEGGVVSDLTLPSPFAVADSLVTDWAIYWPHAQVTLTEIFVGMVIGMSLGVSLGVAIALSRPLHRALYPLVVASQSLPVLALAPILVIWLGFGLAPKIVIVVQIVFFPVTIATIQGLASVSSEVLVFGRSLGASSWMLFWKVRVPAMLPHFFGGLKIGASYAAVAAVIAEWTGATEGLGALMLRANSDYNTILVFGAVTWVTAIGLLLFGAAALMERRLTPWQHGSRRR